MSTGELIEKLFSIMKLVYNFEKTELLSHTKL